MFDSVIIITFDSGKKSFDGDRLPRARHRFIFLPTLCCGREKAQDREDIVSGLRRRQVLLNINLECQIVLVYVVGNTTNMNNRVVAEPKILRGSEWYHLSDENP